MMNEQPTLTSQRLTLRPFALRDAPVVQQLAGERDIAKKTYSIPHPYHDGVAETWISAHPAQYERREAAVFAITVTETRTLIGAVSLLYISREHQNAELGYWVGLPYWNNGYCTEAVQCIIAYGFNSLDLHRICAVHYRENVASGRVMRKSKMDHEGLIRHAVKRWGAFQDLEQYAIINDQHQ